jgi:uncharacterized protein YbjT (DUF2867 family)
MKVLILGGYGTFGGHLVQLLACSTHVKARYDARPGFIRLAIANPGKQACFGSS